MADKFHSELRALSIHLSGNRVTTFGDTDALRNFFFHQYPKWKDSGRVTSIPAGRIPRLFLTGDQTSTHYEKCMSSLQKGESGEIDVFKLLMNTKSLRDGILVLPNVDGNFFNSKVAHVELDIVVIHPRKGAFVFNVKNAKNIKENVLCEDMVKHSNFVRLVQTFKGCTDKVIHTLPVHGVICSLEKTLKVSAMEAGGYFNVSADEKRYIIQPIEMKTFSQSWQSILSQVPDLSENLLYHVDNLAARLGSLNSLEGSVAMVHNQLESNSIQKIKPKVKHGQKILAGIIEESICPESIPVENENMEHLSKKLIALQSSETKGERMSCILWTKDQQTIISNIILSLLRTSSKPCRIIVSGPKGSGKTMLLVFIAHLASKLFESEGQENMVAISDARGASQLLYEKLKTEFKDTTVTVDSGEWVVDKHRKSSLYDKKLLLFDECIMKCFEIIIPTIQDKQHVILFSSLKTEALIKRSEKIRSSFTIFELRNSLRSTCEIVDFVESFRALDPHTEECEVTASHNLTGAGPNIQSISIDVQSDPLHTRYIDTIVSEIGQTIQRAHGLKRILITPFVHQITLQRIISEIQKNGWAYVYRNPADYDTKSTMFCFPGMKNDSSSNTNDPSSNKLGLPLIIFSTGNHVDGSEFGAVLVLLERSLPEIWELTIHASVFIALTRATTLLSVIVNNTTKAPLIHKRIETANEDAVPEIWKNMLMPADVDIWAHSFIGCTNNEVYQSLERIIEDSSWSRAPVLILGEHECLRHFKEIEQPKHIMVNEIFTEWVTDEIKWYKVGTKTVVSARKYENCWIFFDRMYYMDLSVSGFSALVYLAFSQGAILKMHLNTRKHLLMYYMHKEMLGSCPIYTLTCGFLDVKHPNISSICDFFSSFEMRPIGAKVHRLPKEAILHQVDRDSAMGTWNELKDLGNTFFKDGNLKGALSIYIDSIKKLTAEFYSVLQSQEIDFLIKLQDERSKLCTNISKTQFELATHSETGLDVLRMDLSLQYAEKSVKLNPFWFKGHHRVYEAKVMLNEECSPETLKCKKIGASVLSSSQQRSAKRLLVLKEKLEKCVSWNLLRFKDNAFLVDKNGQGHFKSICEAIVTCHSWKEKPISLLINEGVYEEQFPILIGGGTLDLVGNFDPQVCKTNQWILDDPPVVIQSQATPTLFLASSTVSFSRLSIYNWNTDLGNSVVGTVFSSISLFQCAFKSMCGAAVAVNAESSLHVDACRSVDTYGAVLAFGKSVVTVSRSYILRTKVIGLEFRDNASVDVNHCTISHCASQGICNIRGDISIKSCLLEANSYNKTIDEGSIQLDQCHATVKNTRVINQLGNGIVIQYGIGQGIFDGVTIDRCRSSGFLIQAPSTLTGCSVKNCVIGITICNGIKGDVIIDSCVVTSCSEQIFRFPLAVKPIVKGNMQFQSVFETKSEPKEDIKMRPPCIALGRKMHEKSLAIKRFLEDDESILFTLLKSEETTTQFGCAHCTVVPYKTKDRCFLCKDCKYYFYCSVECCNKDKDVHSTLCADAQMHLRAYRDSINRKHPTGRMAEGKKNFNDDDTKKEKEKSGKKYWGPADIVLEDTHLVKFCRDLRCSLPSTGTEVEEGELDGSSGAVHKTGLGVARKGDTNSTCAKSQSYEEEFLDRKTILQMLRLSEEQLLQILSKEPSSILQMLHLSEEQLLQILSKETSSD